LAAVLPASYKAQGIAAFDCDGPMSVDAMPESYRDASIEACA